MGGFFKIAGAVVPEVPHMGKVDPALEGPDNIGNVVGGIGPQAPRAEGKPVVDIIRKAHEAEQFFLHMSILHISLTHNSRYDYISSG
jgi:hypothetical protein